MHVLHRPHPPRLISVCVAAILAIAISLVFASTVTMISHPGNSTGPVIRQSGPASTLPTTVPRWVINPFASLLNRPLPQPWSP